MKSETTTLLLLTEGFPKGKVTESVFIGPEIKALCDKFDRVVIVPLLISGDEELPVSGSGLETDWSLCALTRYRRIISLPVTLLRSVFSRKFISDLYTEAGSFGNFLKSLASLNHARMIRKALKRLMRRLDIDSARTVGYSFWFNPGADAIAEMARAGELSAAVTRAHRYDVYDDAVGFRSHLLRSRTLEGLDAVYVVSKHGTNYLRRQYPSYALKIKTRFLGSSKASPELVARRHENGSNKITFFSCARTEPVKRVMLNLELVSALAGLLPSYNIKWIHAGSGSCFEELRMRCASSDLPSNLKIDLRGPLDNSEVHGIYSRERIDWFLLLSESEGYPISICEAMSYGVPVIATAAGGVAEIVDSDTGACLPLSFNPVSEAFRLHQLVSDVRRRHRMGDRALRRWKEHLECGRLRESFADEISKTVSGK